MDFNIHTVPVLVCSYMFLVPKTDKILVRINLMIGLQDSFYALSVKVGELYSVCPNLHS